MSDTCLLHAENISAGYNHTPAVSDLSLRVDAGEVVALMGANGAGKTTTLLTLSGVLRQFEGQLTIFGRPAERSVLKRVRSGLSLLPEERGVIKTLTVHENLLLGRGPVSAALSYFPELESRLSTRAGLLSGGEQQMLALGRILASKPRLILADELSLGLAPLIVRRLLASLRQVVSDGVGVLIVEQHPRVAMAWSDRAYIMRRGRIELSLTSAQYDARSGEIAALYL
jgi:branched-chain amino acid transport system ATP-binding protein